MRSSVSPKGSVRLAIEEGDAPNAGEEVVAGLARPIATSISEPAGTAFHAKALRAVGFDIGGEDSDTEGAQADETTEAEENKSPASGKTKKFTDPEEDRKWHERSQQKRKGKQQHKDYYGYLGLGNERCEATQKDIDKAYKVAALKFHPDKCIGPKTDEKEKESVESRFKLLGEAYEVLSDARKRREYDSVDAGEDHLPCSCEEGQFYEVFGKAVERLSRFSERRPVPTIGDDNSSDKHVENFYRFFYQFKSWREFPHEDEFDLEEAEGREHRRWMQRENEKLRKSEKQQESIRIKNFVEAMEASDPRVRRKKEAEKKAREEKKEAKRKAQREKEEEERRRLEEERLSKQKQSEEAQAAAIEKKKEKERSKKAMQKERSRLRHLSSSSIDEIGHPGDDAIETLCMRLSHSDIKDLNESMSSRTAEQNARTLNDAYCRIDAQFQAKQQRIDTERRSRSASSASRDSNNGSVNKGQGGKGEESKENGADNRKQAEVVAEASEEERANLLKALRRWPRGTPRRWERVSAHVGRPAEEVQELARRMEESGEAEKGEKGGKGAQEKEEESKWSEAKEMALVKALKAFPKGSFDSEKERWAKIAESVPGKSASECFQRRSAIKARLHDARQQNGDA